jgi:predicted cupin superfamily sugar epimerase
MPIARLARSFSGQLIWSIREPESSAEVVQASVVPGFDPNDHTVAEVMWYISENPDDADRVRALEAAGKARKTIVA